ncbi:MFS transporter [Flammeovirgaceae bacterium SG7u.111]|nr:MFS transporter [Flammeovirgaceae bacterium SG7u.132]WPO37961.1 MFS transporter [Flammeovirgaceae bacterium SG7u.111]
MKNETQKLSTKEKIGYSLGDLSANLIFQTLITYLAFFYTDVFGLEQNTASSVIFWVGMVAALVFNPLIGVLADRTNTKWGKFRPWVLWTAVPLGIASLLTFTTPDLDASGKIIYAVVTYSILLFLYAANNLPYSSLSGVITGDMSERNSLSSYRFVAVMVAQFIVQVFMFPFIEYVGGGDKVEGFSKVNTFLAITGTVLLIITFLTTKERIIPKPEQKSTLKEDFGDLIKNKPWVIMLVVTILVFVTLAMKGGSYLYYFQNYVDQESLSAFLVPVDKLFSSMGLSFDSPASMGFALFNAGGIIFMIVGISFSKNLADKYGKRDVFQLFLFISTVPILLFYFYEPYSIVIIFISQILHGFFYGITIPLLWAMIADVADYSEWKNNRRATAIIFSAMLMGLKIGLTVGGSLIPKINNWYGYIPNSDTQSESALSGIKMLVSIYPSITFFVACALLFFYKLNKQMEVKIEKELSDRRNEN